MRLGGHQITAASAWSHTLAGRQPACEQLRHRLGAQIGEHG
jgi:hypothetical protein